MSLNDFGTAPYGGILGKILARGLLALRERTVMPMLVNTSYSMDAQQIGSAVTINIPSAVTTRAVVANDTPVAAVNHTVNTVTLSLNNWRQTDPFFLSDKDLKDIDAQKTFLPGQVTEAVSALSSYVNSEIFALYTGIYNAVGDPAVTPFAEATPSVGAATAARKLLNAMKAPLENRRGVLDFEAAAAAIGLQAFRDAGQRGDKTTITEGTLGRVYGFDWYEDGQVPSHDTGAATVGTIATDCGGTYAVGTTSIHVDGFSAAPNVGDIFTLAGDTQQYTVLTASVLAGTACDLTISPGLAVATGDGIVLTFIADHTVNLAFHRDAFAFASRPLMDTNLGSGGTIMQTLADPVTGLVMRIEQSRRHKMTAWELDILFGCALVRPELACRIVGDPTV